MSPLRALPGDLVWVVLCRELADAADVISVVRMKHLVLALTLSTAVIACGSDDDSPKDSSSSSADGGATSNETNGGAGAPDTGGSDACHDGCVETLAAKCKNGPTDQASCESTCLSLESGACGAEYASLQSCGKGKVISCSASGLPTIEACADEQAAFVACLNQ